MNIPRYLDIFHGRECDHMHVSDSTGDAAPESNVLTYAVRTSSFSTVYAIPPTGRGFDGIQSTLYPNIRRSVPCSTPVQADIATRMSPPGRNRTARPSLTISNSLSVLKPHDKMRRTGRSHSAVSFMDIEMKGMGVSTEPAMRDHAAPSRPRSVQKAPSRKPKPKQRAQSMTYSDCGRHSNQWLFNNISLTECVKTLFEKREAADDGSKSSQGLRPSIETRARSKSAPVDPQHTENIEFLSRDTLRSYTDSTTASEDSGLTCSCSRSEASSDTSASGLIMARRKPGPGWRRGSSGILKPSA